MPAPPLPQVAPRRASRQIRVGNVLVGGDAPVSVQSMTTTKTADVNATLQQIAELTATGCQIVRVAVPDTDDAAALPEIAQEVADPGHRRHPLPAEVRRSRRSTRAARRCGSTPATSRSSTTRSARSRRRGEGRASRSASASTPARSSTSLLEQVTAGRRAEALVESALWECSLFEEHGFRDIKISVKHNDPVVDGQGLPAARRAVRLPAAPRRDRGRAGVPGHASSRPSASARCSPRASATRSASRCRRRRSRRSRSAWRSCESLGLRASAASTIVACPTCGRVEVDVITLADAGRGGAGGHDSRRSASPSWAASSTARARPARPTSASRPARARARSSSRARSSRPCPSRRSSRRWSTRRCGIAEEMEAAGAALRRARRHGELSRAPHPGRRPLLDDSDLDAALAVVARDPVVQRLRRLAPRRRAARPAPARRRGVGLVRRTTGCTRSATSAPTWCRSRRRRGGARVRRTRPPRPAGTARRSSARRRGRDDVAVAAARRGARRATSAARSR